MNGDIKTVGVVGYIFSNDLTRVVLIEKAKPSWMCGKLNGIGGRLNKIDGGQPCMAMSRECLEETGASIDPLDWIEIYITTFPNFTLHVFYTVGDYHVSKQKEEIETPRWCDLKEIDSVELVEGAYKHIEDALILNLKT